MTKFDWNPRASERVMAARVKAVEEAGGSSHVARELGVSRVYLDDIRYRGLKIDPRIARGIVALAGGKVTLQQIAPDQFKGLTVKELGYTPKPE